MAPSNAGKFQRFFFLISLTAVLASAQSFRGSISGTVTDATGAVVPQAHVTLKSAGTGLSREATTNSEGAYALPDLPPGNLYLDRLGRRIQGSTQQRCHSDRAAKRAVRRDPRGRRRQRVRSGPSHRAYA